MAEVVSARVEFEAALAERSALARNETSAQIARFSALMERSETLESEVRWAQDSMVRMRAQEAAIAERATASRLAECTYKQQAAVVEAAEATEVAQCAALTQRSEALEAELWRAEVVMRETYQDLEWQSMESAQASQQAALAEEAKERETHEAFVRLASEALVVRSAKTSELLTYLLGAEHAVQSRTVSAEGAVFEAAAAAAELADAAALASFGSEAVREAAASRAAEAAQTAHTANEALAAEKAAWLKVGTAVHSARRAAAAACRRALDSSEILTARCCLGAWRCACSTARALAWGREEEEAAAEAACLCHEKLLGEEAGSYSASFSEAPTEAPSKIEDAALEEECRELARVLRRANFHVEDMENRNFQAEAEVEDLREELREEAAERTQWEALEALEAEAAKTAASAAEDAARLRGAELLREATKDAEQREEAFQLASAERVQCIEASAADHARHLEESLRQEHQARCLELMEAAEEMVQRSKAELWARAEAMCRSEAQAQARPAQSRLWSMVEPVLKEQLLEADADAEEPGESAVAAAAENEAEGKEVQELEDEGEEQVASWFCPTPESVSTAQALAQLREELGGAVVVCALGEQLAGPEMGELVAATAKELAAKLGKKVGVLVEGMTGLQELFANSCAGSIRLCSLDQAFTGFAAGMDAEQRRELFRVGGDIYLAFHEGPDVQRQVQQAVEQGAAVVPVRVAGLSVERPGCVDEGLWHHLTRADSNDAAASACAEVVAQLVTACEAEQSTSPTIAPAEETGQSHEKGQDLEVPPAADAQAAALATAQQELQVFTEHIERLEEENTLARLELSEAGSRAASLSLYTEGLQEGHAAHTEQLEAGHAAYAQELQAERAFVHAELALLASTRCELEESAAQADTFEAERYLLCEELVEAESRSCLGPWEAAAQQVVLAEVQLQRVALEAAKRHRLLQVALLVWWHVTLRESWTARNALAERKVIAMQEDLQVASRRTSAAAASAVIKRVAAMQAATTLQKCVTAWSSFSSSTSRVQLAEAALAEAAMRSSALAEAALASEAALLRAEARSSEHKERCEVLSELVARTRSELHAESARHAPVASASALSQVDVADVVRMGKELQQELAEDLRPLYRCLGSGVEDPASPQELLNVQVELTAQVRQLAVWASEGLALRLRVAFAVWRMTLPQSPRTRLAMGVCLLLRRRLDAGLLQALVMSWRSACCGSASSFSTPRRDRPRLPYVVDPRLVAQGLGGIGIFQPQLPGQRPRLRRGDDAGEDGIGESPLPAAALLRPSSLRRLLRRYEGSMRLQERGFQRRYAFMVWTLVPLLARPSYKGLEAADLFRDRGHLRLLAFTAWLANTRRW